MKYVFAIALTIGLAYAAPQVQEDTEIGSLIDDLLDFIKLLPIDKMDAIAKDHLKNDKEFGDVIRYLQGKEWKDLIAKLRQKPTWQDFKKYLTAAGIPVDLIIDVITKYIDSLKPGTSDLGSIRTFLDEIEKIVPWKDLKALLDDKMKNSKDFKELYTKISSDKAHKLVEEVRAMPEVKEIITKLKGMGVKVDEVIAAIYAWLGWGKPSY